MADLEWRDGMQVETVCDSWGCDFHLGEAVPQGEGKPTVPEVLPFVEALYRHHPTGCCLHIVLDDDNTALGHVLFCLGWAKDAKHAQCERLARVLLRMSTTQRTKLAGKTRGM